MRSDPVGSRAALVVLLAGWMVGCATAGPRAPLFHAQSLRLRTVPRDSIRNANGSPRVLSDSAYRLFWQAVAPRVREWARDPRLHLNPAYMAALLAKESGFDPRAVSPAGAYGIAQLTPTGDIDLRTRAGTPAFAWMLPEIRSWPRDSALRAAAPPLPVPPGPAGTAAAPGAPGAPGPEPTTSPDPAVAAAALAAGRTLAAQPDPGARDYVFDPIASTRAAEFWLRMLEAIWTTDIWPGAYGRFAREKLNGGQPLTEDQLLDLATVAYNQGAQYVHTLVDRWGADWTRHLDPEPADYLERIRAYTVLSQR